MMDGRIFIEYGVECSPVFQLLEGQCTQRADVVRESHKLGHLAEVAFLIRERKLEILNGVVSSQLCKKTHVLDKRFPLRAPAQLFKRLLRSAICGHSNGPEHLMNARKFFPLSPRKQRSIGDHFDLEIGKIPAVQHGQEPSQRS